MGALLENALAQLLFCALQRLKNLIHVLQENLALLVKKNPVVGAVKKCHAQLFFQTGNRNAESWRGNKQFLRSFGYFACICYSFKIFQLLKFRKTTFLIDRVDEGACKKVRNTCHGAVYDALTAFNGCPSHVGRNDAVGGGVQGIASQNGFTGHHIHRSSTELAILEGGGNIGFVQESTSGGVQQNSAVFHFGNGVGIDHTRIF